MKSGIAFYCGCQHKQIKYLISCSIFKHIFNKNSGMRIIWIFPSNDADPKTKIISCDGVRSYLALIQYVLTLWFRLVIWKYLAVWETFRRRVICAFHTDNMPKAKNSSVCLNYVDQIKSMLRGFVYSRARNEASASSRQNIISRFPFGLPRLDQNNSCSRLQIES